MTPRQIALIKQAQDYCRKRKEKGETIHCPFSITDVTINVCELCFTWVDLEDLYYQKFLSGSHPCLLRPPEEIIKRFWRNPKKALLPAENKSIKWINGGD